MTTTKLFRWAPLVLLAGPRRRDPSERGQESGPLGSGQVTDPKKAEKAGKVCEPKLPLPAWDGVGHLRRRSGFDVHPPRARLTAWRYR